MFKKVCVLSFRAVVCLYLNSFQFPIFIYSRNDSVELPSLPTWISFKYPILIYFLPIKKQK